MFRALVPSYTVDPVWGDVGSSLVGLERGLREMDRLYGDLNKQFRELAPNDQRRGRDCDVGFPDSLVQNPVVTDKDGKKHLNFKFDVRQFKPEEISIKSYDDSRIEVCAKHESKDDHHHVYREYSRTCRLPPGVDLATVKSQLNPDGVLSIEAPLPAIEEKAPGKQQQQVQARNEPIPMAIEHQGKKK